MGFWEEHATAEATHAEVRAKEARAKLPPCSQNAPMECTCGHVGTDVLLGVCRGCLLAWEADHG